MVPACGITRPVCTRFSLVFTRFQVANARSRRFYAVIWSAPSIPARKGWSDAGSKPSAGGAGWLQFALRRERWTMTVICSSRPSTVFWLPHSGCLALGCAAGRWAGASGSSESTCGPAGHHHSAATGCALSSHPVRRTPSGAGQRVRFRKPSGPAPRRLPHWGRWRERKSTRCCRKRYLCRPCVPVCGSDTGTGYTVSGTRHQITHLRPCRRRLVLTIAHSTQGASFL